MSIGSGSTVGVGSSGTTSPSPVPSSTTAAGVGTLVPPSGRLRRGTMLSSLSLASSATLFYVDLSGILGHSFSSMHNSREIILFFRHCIRQHLSFLCVI